MSGNCMSLKRPFILTSSRRICTASVADRLPVQRELWGSHHDHRLWQSAHVQHVLPESQGLPVWSPWRLCGHGAVHRCWTRHRSHHRNPHLYHHTVRWVAFLEIKHLMQPHSSISHHNRPKKQCFCLCKQKLVLTLLLPSSITISRRLWVVVFMLAHLHPCWRALLQGWQGLLWRSPQVWTYCEPLVGLWSTVLKPVWQYGWRHLGFWEPVGLKYLHETVELGVMCTFSFRIWRYWDPVDALV